MKDKNVKKEKLITEKLDMGADIKNKEMERQVKLLWNEIFTNNFSAHQDFNKTCNFNTRLKVPHYDILPSSCEAGELLEKGGNLYICSSANNWTIVGTQT